MREKGFFSAKLIISTNKKSSIRNFSTSTPVAYVRIKYFPHFNHQHTSVFIQCSYDLLSRHLNGTGGRKGKTSVHLPLSFPLTKPSHSRNHCMLMQYMTTGDSSSWNALLSYREGGRQRGSGGGVSDGDKREERGCKKGGGKAYLRMKGFRREQMKNLINSLW